MDDDARRWPEHDLRWHAARLRAMGRDRDADNLGALSPVAPAPEAGPPSLVTPLPADRRRPSEI